jgi:hypothetical protein
VPASEPGSGSRPSDKITHLPDNTSRLTDKTSKPPDKHVHLPDKQNKPPDKTDRLTDKLIHLPDKQSKPPDKTGRLTNKPIRLSDRPSASAYDIFQLEGLGLYTWRRRSEDHRIFASSHPRLLKL